MKLISKKSLILALSFAFISLSPSNVMANVIAEQYEQSGQYDLALYQYQMDALSDKKNPDLLNKIGSLLYRLKRYKEAVTYFTQAIIIDNDNSIYHYNIAMSYVKLSKDDDAYFSFKRAILTNPNVEKYYHKFGNLLYSHKKYEDAIVEYNNILKLNSKYPEAYYNLGLSYKELKQYEKSLSYFRKYLKLKPNDTKAIQLYKELQSQINNDDLVDSPSNGYSSDPFGNNKPSKPNLNDDPFNDDNNKKMTIFGDDAGNNKPSTKNDSVD
jgi:tetratricopeptide (TPR) repeat protein